MTQSKDNENVVLTEQRAAVLDVELAARAQVKLLQLWARLVVRDLQKPETANASQLGDS